MAKINGSYIDLWKIGYGQILSFSDHGPCDFIPYLLDSQSEIIHLFFAFLSGCMTVQLFRNEKIIVWSTVMDIMNKRNIKFNPVLH